MRQSCMTEERSFRVALELPEGSCSFDCGEDEYIWDAAAANGIVLPAICQQGRCLTCAGRLLAGTVKHDSAAAFFAEDKRESYIFLCPALPLTHLPPLTHH